MTNLSSLFEAAFLVSLLCQPTYAFLPHGTVQKQPFGRFFIPDIARTHTSLQYQNNATDSSGGIVTTTAPAKKAPPPVDRFEREASKEAAAMEPCILTIHGQRYNLTAWANAHPGGVKVLQRFHGDGKDATRAFEAADHSAAAYDMLKDFLIPDSGSGASTDVAASEAPVVVKPAEKGLPRIRKKLFTKEDPIGVHKYLGLFCLINFIGRHVQMYFRDPAAGLGSQGHPWFSLLCLLPHGLLSLSSLIFHTVPRERVVGKPMIWKEFRLHNILFGVRSVLTAAAASLAIAAGNTPLARRLAVAFSCACVLVANVGADMATERLRAVSTESTTATMPYWDGCSIDTQKRFKGFYAYCQFMATLACLAVANPAWPLTCLLAIQMASLLMTLVRKGLITARAYHYGYTAALVMPWLVGARAWVRTGCLDFPAMIGLGYALYQLRRRGVSKYQMWIPVVLLRFFVGDSFINYQAW